MAGFPGDGMALTGEVIHGRPDLADHQFGKTQAKRFPPYVFGVRGGSALVHRVARVTLRWWMVGEGGETLHRLVSPLALAHTRCGYFVRLVGETARTCTVPSPSALLCAACHGEGRNFAKASGARDRRTGLTRTEAHVRLGCVVNGYEA